VPSAAQPTRRLEGCSSQEAAGGVQRELMELRQRAADAGHRRLPNFA
jgi:hypothetical protein